MPVISDNLKKLPDDFVRQTDFLSTRKLYRLVFIGSGYSHAENEYEKKNSYLQLYDFPDIVFGDDSSNDTDAMVIVPGNVSSTVDYRFRLCPDDIFYLLNKMQFENDRFSREYFVWYRVLCRERR